MFCLLLITEALRSAHSIAFVIFVHPLAFERRRSRSIPRRSSVLRLVCVLRWQPVLLVLSITASSRRFVGEE